MPYPMQCVDAGCICSSQSTKHAGHDSCATFMGACRRQQTCVPSLCQRCVGVSGRTRNWRGKH
jgi:hypothetical protein